MSDSPPSRAASKSRAFAEMGRLLLAGLDRVALLWLGTALVVVCLGGLAAGLAPLALKTIIDGLAGPPGVPAAAGRLELAVGFYVLALLFQRFCEQVQAFAYAAGEHRLVRRVSGQAFAHILSLPMAFHLEHRSGSLSQSLAQGVLGLRLILTHLVLTILPVLVQLIVAGFVLHAVFGPGLDLTILAALAAYAAVFAWGVARLAAPVRKISEAQVDVGGATTDSLMNVEAIKAYTAERRFVRRYDQLLGHSEDRWRQFLRLRLVNGLAVAAVFGVAVAAVHLDAGRGVVGGAMTLGAFVLVNTYLLQLIHPLEMLGFAVRDIGQGVAYLTVLMALLREPPERDEGHTALATGRAPAAHLTFEAVSFAHGPRDTLRNVSFTASAGQRIAIVGPSGAGKSSLVRLVLRFYEPSRGRILLDGQSIDSLPLKRLRGQIALVSQETILFNDTLRENIRLAHEDADESEIINAADSARLSAFLSVLPDGLDTHVGERGLKLSGGEKQRVSIARAALKRARLIIFDEATSALDPRTEQAVWQAMQDLSRGATTLVITHRLSTIENADQILVLDHGRIVERGVHADLLALDGLYAHLWSTQHPWAATDVSTTRGPQAQSA